MFFQRCNLCSRAISALYGYLAYLVNKDVLWVVLVSDDVHHSIPSLLLKPYPIATSYDMYTLNVLMKTPIIINIIISIKTPSNLVIYLLLLPFLKMEIVISTIMCIESISQFPPLLDCLSINTCRHCKVIPPPPPLPSPHPY